MFFIIPYTSFILFTCLNYVFYILKLGTPESPEAVFSLITEITNLLTEGNNVVVHCLAGLGRTGIIFFLIYYIIIIILLLLYYFYIILQYFQHTLGLVVACVLVNILKKKPQSVIKIVREARNGTIQTARQVSFVEQFAKV
jgi:protein-tyrosine phosphatase